MSPKERRAYDEHLNVIMIQNDVLETIMQATGLSAEEIEIIS